MAQIEVKVKLDLPPGVELLGYERLRRRARLRGEVSAARRLPLREVRPEEPATYEYKNTVYVVRDLDLWGQPSFFIFQPCFHRCSRCGHRQEHLAPFKRKKVMYTYRFEEYVLRMLIGSNEEEVAAAVGHLGGDGGTDRREPVEGRQADRPGAGDQARGIRRNQPQEAAQAVRDGDDRPDRPGVAEGAGGGEGPGHRRRPSSAWGN